MSPTPIIEVVTQHAEEAAFLWLLRDLAVGAPHYLLWELAKLDNRVEAHLDGLRIAGDPGWEIGNTGLAEGDAGEVFAAAVLAFEGGQDERIGAVLKAGTAAPDKARGLVSALGWLPFDRVESHIHRLLAADAPAEHHVGLAASAVHRRHPGKPLTDALVSADSVLRARALRAAGELGQVAARPTVRKSCAAEDPACRFWANWSVALLGGDKEKEAVANLQGIAEAKGPYQGRAVQTAMRRLEPRAGKAWQAKLAGKPELLRLAVIGAGALGDPELVPWLIGQMTAKPLTRVAGEAFSLITGVDLAYQDLDVRPPEDTGAGPTENPADENVALDLDDNLPWPNPEAVRKWWSANEHRFAKGTRHLLGKPVTPDSLQHVLRTGRQRQRAAAALELVMLQPEHGLFEVRAPGFRQQTVLG
jgi:uncharacterized protein (TIGR02270 family)